MQAHPNIPMPEPIRHIYWFAPFNLSCPSTRYRGKIPLEYLQENQRITFDFVYPARSLRGVLKFLGVFFSAIFFRKKASLIVIQKVCTNRLYANALKVLIWAHPHKTLYDIDDAEHLRTATNTLHFFLKNCAAVSVGSQALWDYCRVFNPNVFIQTSPIPYHGFRKKQRNEQLTIGWVGDFGNGNPISRAFSHKTSMYQLFFPQLLAIDHPIKLCLIGVKNPDDITEINHYFAKSPHIMLDIPEDLNWENDQWVYPKIRQFDIGIAPMVDHPFNQAKSAFKSKQYLSCGVPVIASDVGENSQFVHHKVNGFLCHTARDFAQAIRQFIEMSDEEYWSLSKNCLAGSAAYSVANYGKMFQ